MMSVRVLHKEWVWSFAGVLAVFALLVSPELGRAATCERTITADVVALDQIFFYNRLGAVNPAGMIYALRRDVVALDGGPTPSAGDARLRSDKRPRPIVLRMNVGDCLTVNFTNLLAGAPVDDEQPATRTASVHVMGMQLVGSIASDGSNVGANASSLVAPGGSATYTFYAEREGTYLLYSTAAQTGGEGDGGSLAAGLFGGVNVEPRGAEWYRSQVTEDDLALASDGTTAAGHPLINYNAVYPPAHPRAGLPILKMLQGSEIVHTDLNAIITGPNAGRYSSGTYRSNPIYPDRDQPFREFTVIFHDEIMALQAFDEFEDAVLGHTLHSVRDGFAINYGTGGIGAEILANRKGVGPMKDCVDCKYEEFFLTSWALGDPAMVVDVPANATDGLGNLILGGKATKAFYPDDPSNVHHSYMNDHVKFRNLMAGPKEHHIFHLHAHQWVHTPDSDNSSYLDSQAIGPGSGYTYEITHNGSGNRNKTVGDSIFHCHFYPHFAQGMWELWRTHDVFEAGTVLTVDNPETLDIDEGGFPAPGSRALPDGEILAGTPIPAVVPLPTLAMAPMPDATVQIVDGQVQITGAGHPGYPFFIPGVAGHRPPHPPLDTVDDGGLPRHVIVGGTATSNETRLDFDKRLVTANALSLPETGTPVELTAMAFHATRTHTSFKPDGSGADFTTNGLPAVAGAPYADPCVSDAGEAVGSPRLYKAAAIQLDMKLNKAGWHHPQARMLALWDDVAPTLAETRPPEPLFFRANTNDCITYYHTNLVPDTYEQDDFQVRTPTDVIGQHIHLVKFDVTASDGSGNGFNYEDGTFSPQAVTERIDAINASGGSWDGNPGTLTAVAHPFFTGTIGAQTTVQRWYADETLNNLGKDRTLRTVYTHDHFSPSTHQQVGLYAGLVIEPQGSTWSDSESGAPFGSRDDGGPTSWRADIVPPNPDDSYREFLLEYADFQLAYKQPCGVGDCGPEDEPVSPPAKAEIGLPFIVQVAANCPGGASRPCPEAISADDPGTMTVNYRNEPIALRVRDPLTNTQAAGEAGDLSFAFASNIIRADPAFNVQPDFYLLPLTGGVEPGDPFTPLMRAYEKDKVQIRIMVGAQEEGHNFSIHGVRWLSEPSDPNSGFRNSQMMGISEHFEFELPPLPVESGHTFADYLYKPGSSTDDLWNGLWGILRVYNNPGLSSGGALAPAVDLRPLPNNPGGTALQQANSPSVTASQAAVRRRRPTFDGVCPIRRTPRRRYSVAAVTAQEALPGGTLVYNPRTNQGGMLHDPTAILFVRTSDLDGSGKLRPGVPIEPLILRANAGDCIEVTLTNLLPTTLPDLPGFFTLPPIVEHFNANQVAPSHHVGLHPQLVEYEVTNSDGANVGFNPVQTVGPGETITYRWYAGTVKVNSDGSRTATPVEFGATNLMSSDPIKHPSKGAIGALIIEPFRSRWREDPASRASATVRGRGGRFQEFVLLLQNSINLRYGDDNSAVRLLADTEDSEDSGQKAFNYRTEPMWKRLGFAPDATLETTRTFDFTNAVSNTQVGGDPVTPLFAVRAGTPVRFRLLHPGGNQRNNVFQIHGHIWEEQPFVAGSTVLGSNPLSEWKGSQEGIGPTSHFNFLLKNGAGGGFNVPGDYLYRDQASFQFDGGLWGIFRVFEGRPPRF
jgi:manganese oxidase